LVSSDRRSFKVAGNGGFHLAVWISRMRLHAHYQRSETIHSGQSQDWFTAALAVATLVPVPPRLRRRQRKVELAVEAAGAPQGRVDGIDAVGRANDDNLAACVEAVHERQQRRHDGGVDLVLLCRADGREAVDLVKEYDRRLAPAGLLEEQPQLALRLADPLRETVGALNGRCSTIQNSLR